MTATLTGAAPRFEKGLREVGEGTWAWLQPNGGWGEANAGLVIGEGEALLVDTLWDERLAREMLAKMEPVLDGRPIVLAVNTHSDGDHWWGNAALGARTEIITPTRSREAMDGEASPSEMARMGRLSRLGAYLPGPLRPLSAFVDEMLSPFDFAGTELRFPDRTFSGRETLDFGGREAELIEVGPAHTPGDSIVYLPDVGVVFAADVLFSAVTPVMWFGPLESWLAAIETLLALDADVYVPGHGAPGGLQIVEEMRDYMTWLGHAAREQSRLGRRPLEATRAMIASEDFRRWEDWESPERLLISVDAIYRADAGCDPVGSSPMARARLFSRIAKLRKELETRR